MADTDDLQQRAHDALAGRGDPQPLTITLEVSGGVPGEREELDFRLDGQGHITARHLDELEQRDERVDTHLERDRVQTFFDGLLATGAINQPSVRPPFPADTVVGVVTVLYKDAVVDRSYVLPDPGQLSDATRAAAESGASVHQLVSGLVSELAEGGASP